MNNFANDLALIFVLGLIGGIAVASLVLEVRSRRRSRSIQRVLDRERRSDDQTLQSAQLAAAGRVAGGLAHDFNNLLTVINGHAQLAAEQPDLPVDVGLSLEAIRRAGRRGADLIRELRAYDRAEVLSPSVLDPAAVLQRLLPELRRMLGREIQLELQRSDLEMPIVGDEIQFGQVILNLVLNARDAILARPADARPGRVLVRLGVMEIGKSDARGLAAGSHLAVSVSDNGIGMDPGVRQRASQAFFTTKPQASAAGLGLTLVQAITRQAGGAVEIESESDQGTEVRVLWPVAAGDRDPATADGPRARDGERVLLVVPDPGLRGRLTVNLSGLGYTVDPEADAGQAVHRLRGANPGVPAAMILPSAQPGTTDLLQRLWQVRPDLRVILLCERERSDGSAGGPDMPLIRRLVKPFTTRQLATTLRQVLDAPLRALADQN